jgi:prepilin-type N-terminal cleavage/methylation domain-containing protein
MKKTTHNSPVQGFTLIEMIGVLAIIGILSAVVAPRVIESIRDAKVTSAISSVNAAKSAALNFYQRYDRFPLDTVTGLGVVVDYRSDPTGGTNFSTTTGRLDFGDILVRQELLLESERTPIGEEEEGTKTWAVGCSKPGEAFIAGGGSATGYGESSFLFKSAGKGTRIVYFYMPNLTLQEAAALGTKVNGPFPSGVTGDEGAVNETIVGSVPANIDGANAWFVDNGDSTFDGYVYVSHQ